MYLNFIIYLACFAVSLAGGVIAYKISNRRKKDRSGCSWVIIDGEYFRRIR